MKAKGKSFEITFQSVFLVGMFVLGFLLRVVFISGIPPGLANDEANIILNGQSFLHTGENIPGVVTGVLGTPTGDYGGGVHSEISSYFLSIFYAVIGFSPATAKLPFAVASMGVVVFIYLITKELFGKRVSYISLALSVFNPWLIHFGRSGYEAILSTLFYLVAIWMFLRNREWKVLYSFLFLVLGFLSYFSAKVLVFPISLTLLVFTVLLRSKKQLKPVIVLNILVVVFLFCYFGVLRNSASGTRISELRNSSVAVTVDDKRTHSVEFPLERLIENKYVEEVYLRVSAGLGTLSPKFVFLNGQPEPSGHLSIPEHGPMYLVDMVMVFAGAIYLSRKYVKEFLGLSLLVGATLLPNFLNIQNSTYSMRPVILVPVLIMVVSAGIYAIWRLVYKKKFGKVVVIGIGFCYVFLVARFVYQYYFRMPVENNAAWFLEDRVVAHYIRSDLVHNPGQEVVWVTPNAHFAFYRYVYFGGLYTSSQSIRQINEKLKLGLNEVGNVKVLDGCPDNYREGVFYVVDASVKCDDLPSPVASVANIDDAGVRYTLVSDPLCGDYTHKRYPLIREHRLLNVEKLSDEEFCENYVTEVLK